jgi:RNase P/RNase MRP subunit p30
MVEELQKLLYSLGIVMITIPQRVEHDLNPHRKEIQISLVQKKILLEEK